MFWDKGDDSYSIELGVIQLSHTMPVNGGTIVFQVVGDVNDKGISPVSNERWTGNGAVESHGVTLISIWRQCCVHD